MRYRKGTGGNKRESMGTREGEEVRARGVKGTHSKVITEDIDESCV